MKEEKQFKIEEFAKAHQSDFQQVEEFDTEKHWVQLQTQQDRGAATSWQIHIGRNWRWSIAASISLLILCGVFLWPKSNQEGPITLAEYNPELAQEVSLYLQEVRAKESELDLESINPKDFPELFQELALLEEIHQELLKDIPKFNDQDKMISILQKYYSHKIKMLERLSREIQKQKQKTDQDEIRM